MSSILDCLNWFKKAKPAPTNKDIHTQLGVHFEEVAEMIHEITPLDTRTAILLSDAHVNFTRLASHLKAGNDIIEIKPENRIAFIDAIADQLVTAVGSAYVLGMDPDGAWDEVNESNFSKFNDFGDPIFDPNGKVMKGPNYRKAVLDPFV